LSNGISDKDKKDWQNFISNSQKLPNKDLRTSNIRNNKTKTIDLHGYSLDEANKVIEKFIIDSYKDSVNKLIVVTGKGLHSKHEKDPYVSKDLGILKNSVPEFIKSNSKLMKNINFIESASLVDGGSGAFYIYLKKYKKNL
tara:strand:+ start:71 stop:493 length:423 start_codon:yes stop_codon:yes gene_type:complete